MYLSVALSWRWHHSPWPGARCLLGPPAPVGSPSQPLVWWHDWLGTPPARPSSGCPAALGSFPFSDPPGAPSELPSQTCQGAEKKQSVSEWLSRWLGESSRTKTCTCACVWMRGPVHDRELIQPSFCCNDDGKGWWMCLWLKSMTFYQLRFFKMSSPFVFDSLVNPRLYGIISPSFLYSSHTFPQVMCTVNTTYNLADALRSSSKECFTPAKVLMVGFVTGALVCCSRV